MKVMHILNSHTYSGAENVVCQIIRMFREDPSVQMCYCSPYGEKLKEMLTEEGICYVPLSEMSVGELRRVLKEEKPDIIHAHDMRASFFAALSCGRTPLISHVHNNAFDARRLSVKSIAYLMAGIKAGHIFWVSRSSYEGYLFHKLFSRKSTVLYNIIDWKQVCARAEEAPECIRYDAVYVGRLTYQKHPERLMELAALAKKKKPDFRLAVIGMGELDEAVKALAKQLDLETNVDFLGFQSNPMRLMRDGSCMILPSRWEGTPMCALEAMALGVPVVSTPTDGLVDLIEDGKDGFLSNENQVLADKMVLLATDAELRQRMSQEAVLKSRRINDRQAYKAVIAKHYEEVRG